MLEKKFEPQKLEKGQYKKWESSGGFAANEDSNQTPYTIMMPPPNVTGSLHMGHALNMTMQDILTRYRRMKGDDALWQPGTDHAGIATQMVVERQLEAEGKSRKELGREGFLEKVWEWKEQSGGTIVSQLRRLGATPDWERERFTMDEGLSKAVRKVFVQLYNEGLIYKDKRLVNWDPKLKTAVSDLEVELRETKGHMWHIRYPVEGETEQFVTVATTRPETMLGDTAVAVNPEDERYKHLIGKNAVLPIVGRLIPIIADEHADPEQGSGVVKITPAHDFNDFEVGKRHDLPMINIFDEGACINENAPEEYQGLDRFVARKKLLEELEALDLLVKVDSIKHAVPYDEKSKSVVLEPFLTDQWYVDAEVLAKPALEAVESGKTKFVPKQWENTYYNWMRNIQPWCISRQLWWGHQIPAWYGPEGTVFVAETEEEAMAQAREKFDAHVVLTRDPDVLDTWFSSALWPFSTLGWPDKVKEVDRYYPGDVLITGFDIIFFWVARMMMMGLHFMGEVPFHTVYIHALVRDAKGQKMSKSKGNVIDPLELIDEYGADALRFTLTAMAAQGRDIKLSEDRVQGYRNFGTKLWNAARYCQMNDCVQGDDNFDPAKVEATLNKWIVSEVVTTEKRVAEAIETYKFNEAANALYQFVWGTFCDWYLEFTKPVLSEDSEIATETRNTTAWVLQQILVILNPIMPFITEELDRQFFNLSGAEGYIFQGEWPEYDEALVNKDAQGDIEWLIKFISEIRSVRADMNVPAGAKINLIVKGASEQTKANLKTYEEISTRMARLSEIVLSEEEAPQGSIQTVVDEATLILPIAEIIDLDKERDRLKKEISRLEDDIKVISKKLDNQNFVSKAPEEVVNEQRKRRDEAESTLEKLSKALKQLGVA